MRAVVVAIARHQAAHGYAPSVRDVMRGAGFVLHLAHGALAAGLRGGGADPARTAHRPRDQADGGGSGARR